MKGYEAYRVIESKWISSVPSRWDIKRLKNVTSYISRGQTPIYTDDVTCAKVVNQATFSRGVWNIKNVRYTTVSPIGNESIPQRGDVLLASTGGGVLGKVFYFDEPGVYIADSHVTIIRTKDILNSKYMYYYLSVHYDTINGQLARGSTNQTELQEHLLKNVPVPVPSRAEQEQIVRYLDWQVSKINRLIAAKRKQIELLKAKRQQELSRVMQYGLNPNDTIKDSGIRWIGQTPKRWAITALKRCASLRSGITLGKQYPLGTETISVPYLRVANVQTGYVDISDIAYLDVTEAEAVQYQLPSGCVLMTEGGDRDKLGRGCVWNNSIYPCIHQNHVFAVTTNDDLLCNRYLEYLSASDIGRMYFDITAIRTTNLACTNATKVLAFTFPLPDRKEQDRIIDYLDNLMSQYAKLISSIQRQISTLNDLCNRLISDVVTGQVDVRGIEVPECKIVEQTEVLENGQEDIMDEC